MMRWRFSLLDRNNLLTIIDEPINWDQNDVTLKRDLDTHGILLSVQGESLEFVDIAAEIIKAEYDSYGSQGIMTVIFEEDCGDGFEEFTRGRFDFNKYSRTCGIDGCTVKIFIEKTGDVVDFKNRINQKVNLETTKAFDEITVLPSYTKLPFNLTLPSKGIFIQDYSKNLSETTENFLGITEVPTGNFIAQSEYGQLYIGLNKTVSSEIGNFDIGLSPTYDTQIIGGGGTLWGTSTTPIVYGTFNRSFLWPLYANPIINFPKSSPNYEDLSNPCIVNYRLKGSITALNSHLGSVRLFFLRLPKGLSGELTSHYEFIDVQDIYIPIISENTTRNFDLSYTNNNFVLNKDDRIYWFISYYDYKLRAQIQNGGNAFSVTFSTESFFKLTNLSKTPATSSKVFAINEAFSRVTEAITNNKMKVYSEYFGRTDSQPYSLANDGCGSLEVITDGLRIRRQETKVVGKTNLFSVSLQDLFEGANPIHNIGMGIEPDTNRNGFNRLRIEPWKYFYKDDIIMTCIGVNKITRSVFDKEIYSTFQYGYAKWEAEEYTGLDEFLTKRTSRSSLTGVKNELLKLTKFIGSGYALEITRRKGNEDSKDWRYDKETFIICVKRNSLRLATLFSPGGWQATYNTVEEMLAGSELFIVGNTITISGAGTLQNGNFLITRVVPITGGFQVYADGITQTTVSIATFSNSGLVAELGNILSPSNIIDPDTLYNYRISPLRNAMRWLNNFFRSYRVYDNNAKLIFTDGDGNYFAQGQMKDMMCRLENAVIAENQTINKQNFSDTAQARPFLLPERVVYDYPMNSQEYKIIEQNPYGKIYFENDCEKGYGCIDTIIYKPSEGVATFNLIPKI